VKKRSDRYVQSYRYLEEDRYLKFEMYEALFFGLVYFSVVAAIMLVMLPRGVANPIGINPGLLEVFFGLNLVYAGNGGRDCLLRARGLFRRKRGDAPALPFGADPQRGLILVPESAFRGPLRTDPVAVRIVECSHGVCVVGLQSDAEVVAALLSTQHFHVGPHNGTAAPLGSPSS
jgi:hypothetical protein